MNRLLYSLLALTVVLGIVASGARLLRADGPAAMVLAPPPRPVETAAVEVSDVRVEMQFAVKPKELSAAVKNGLEYLVKHQQEDGGWCQGGGWRSQGSGRVEGAADPSDVGNTSLAMLALLRAGNSPVDGAYRQAMQKGLAFVLARVEKADPDSLSITDVPGTQLQSKIGTYVDTFLTAMLLAELRGKGGDQEKRLTAALQKTMTKIVKNQRPDGGYVNNGGWAPILSVAIANKSIARAQQNGVTIDRRVFDRAFAQSQAAAAGPMTTGKVVPALPGASSAGRSVAVATSGTLPPALPGAGGGPVAMAGGMTGMAGMGGIGGGFGGVGGGMGMMGMSGGGIGSSGSMGGSGLGSSFGDAGVTLYRLGQGAGNSQDVVNSLRIDAEKARKVLQDVKASQKDKQEAQKKIDDLARTEKENARVQEQLLANVNNDRFTAGFGSNGGEEFLSFLNIGETLLVKGGKEWEAWDKKMTIGLEKAQDQGGSWSGQHCITGKTFCTSAALLVLMADRTPFPAAVLTKQEAKP